jgi:hypothetical protein
MKSKKQGIENLLKKVDKVTKENKLDLSSGEDLSIGIMNLIAIEEHLFYTSQKTGKKKYLDLLNEIRVMRTELLKEIIKDYEGEVWCISKHLLAASMRVMEVGTKELKKGNKDKAWDLFEKSYNLYSLFWGLNLGIVKTDKVSRKNNSVNLVDDKDNKSESVSLFSKLGQIVQKAIDCCKE